MISLPIKYRPNDFSQVCSQEMIIKILSKYIETENFPNVIMFTGLTGTGKTTLARIFANRINHNQGSPIEIDGASNNGVDNIRAIIEDSKERSLDSKYKVYIIDEAHQITNAGWNAFLKCLEEPPKYTIFILCTTDPQKVPETIQNRVTRFNLLPINSDEIVKRLNEICINEGFTNYQETTTYISKIANGSMRSAISFLGKVADYSSNMDIDTTLNILGAYSYDIMFNITNSILDSSNKDLLTHLDILKRQNLNIDAFTDQYIVFILDITKYCILNDIKCTKIPESLKDKLDYVSKIENNINYFKWFLNQLLEIKKLLKNSLNPFNILEISLLNLIRG